MEHAVLIGLVMVAVAVYYGLTNIANALRSRRINIKLIYEKEEQDHVAQKP